MLSVEDNKKISQVGPGTPMGNLLRRYWIPFLETSELDKSDGDPVRVFVLGERLVAFRDSNGQVGLLDRLCPHRRADLFFGRNEECGLRCTYHGWKFDTAGNCVDMPNEPEESNFKDKVHLGSYPVREQAGILWAYMGPEKDPPAGLPQLEWMSLPTSHLMIYWDIQETNFVQAVEGGIDSAHINYLHSTLDAYHMTDAWREQNPRGSRGALSRLASMDKRPRMFARETDYGVAIGAGRRTETGDIYWRINQFWMPFLTQPPGFDVGGNIAMFVPMDDGNTARWVVQYRMDRPWRRAEIEELDRHKNLMPGLHQPLRRNTTDMPTVHYRKANFANDYLMDRQKQRELTFTGIIGVGEQDSSIQEGMGPLVDRENEHLGTTDVGIIQMRRKLLKAVADLERGIEPYSANHPEVYAVRAGSVVLPPDKDWAESPETIEAQAPRTLGLRA